MGWLLEVPDLLWRSAWAIVPLVLLVAAVCRWLPARPVTRHALWVIVLGAFLAPLFGPLLPTGVIFATRGLLADSTAAVNATDSSNSIPSVRVIAEELPLPAEVTLVSRSRNTNDRSDTVGIGSSIEAGGFTRTRERSRSSERSISHAEDPPSKFASDLPDRDDLTSVEHRPHVSSRETAPVDPIPYRTPEIGGRTPAIFAQRETQVLETDDSQAAIPLRGDANTTSAADTTATGTTAPASIWRTWALALIGVRDALLGLPTLPMSVWLAGTGLIASVYAASVLRFRRRFRRARRAPPSVERMVALLARKMGLRRVPATVMVDDCVSPLVWCGRRPRLVLPRELWAQLDAVSHRAILCHELAHLRRRDHWVRPLELIVSTLFWWHPLMWWVKRRLNEEADLCCDAWVTWLMPRKRRAYAEALLKARQFAGDRRGVAPAAAMGVISAGTKRFARRLTMVMTHNARPRTSIAGIGLIGLLAAAGWVAIPAWACPDKPDTTPCSKAAPVADCAVPAVPALPALSAPPAGRAVAFGWAPAQQPPVADAPQAPRQIWYTPNSYGRLSATPSGETLIVTGGGFGANGEDDDTLSKKLTKLDRELARLNAEMKKLSTEFRFRRPPAPPAAPLRGGIGLTQVYRSGETLSRTYKLPKGKLEKLTALMIRDDVPINVRPLEDALEVHATAAQHDAFAAFVKALDGKQSSRKYKLPEGKLEAFSALMLRADVPIIVRPQKGHLSAQVTGLEDAALSAFIELIHPTGKKSRLIGVGGGSADLLRSRLGAQTGAKTDYTPFTVDLSTQYAQARADADTAQAKAGERAKHAQAATEAYLRARASTRAKSHQHEAEAKHLAAQAQELLRNAAALERDAEALEDRADELRDKAEAIEDDDPERAKKIEHAARELERKVRALERSAAKLERQADRLEHQTDETEPAE